MLGEILMMITYEGSKGDRELLLVLCSVNVFFLSGATTVCFCQSNDYRLRDCRT